MTSNFTKIFIGVAVSIIMGYDLIVATDSIEGNTISEVLINMGSEYPIVAFIVGAVVGHLWWPLNPIRKKNNGTK